MKAIPTAGYRSHGFTLIELMLSTAIISLIMLILVSVTTQTSATWRYTTGKIEQFRESRAAFESITTKISQATLNTYWDYGYDSAGLPTRYERRSELRFNSGSADALIGSIGPVDGSGEKGTRVTHAVFFHAPIGIVGSANPQYHGLESLLNVWGYYVELNSDSNFRPPFLNNAASPAPLRYRFRLMEFMQPSENLSTYSYTSGVLGGKPVATTYQGTEWFKNAVNATPSNTSPSPSRPVAENIIALIITPRLSKRDEQEVKGGASEIDSSPLAPKYSYDSSLTKNDGQAGTDPRINPKNQLPPVLQITMVAIDETSAARLNLGTATGDIFKLKGKFADTTKYTSDLVVQPGAAADVSLEKTLIDKKVNYRIFTTNVPIRAAKWSRDQVN